MSFRSVHSKTLLVISMVVIVGAILAFGRQQQSAAEPIAAPGHSVAQQAKPKTPFPTYGTTQYGVYIEGAQMADQANSQLGAHNFGLIGLFEHWDTKGVSSPNKLRSICNEGLTPLISWESWGGKNSGTVYALQDIAKGKYDDLIRHYFKSVKSICKDNNIIIRFNHEMEMRPSYGSPWTPWQGDLTYYARAWRHVVSIARAEKHTNIKWLWSPNRADEYVYDYYPGHEYVNYVGITLNHPTITGTIYDSFETFYAPNKPVLESFGKPIIIGETAYYNQNETAIANWINGTFAYTKQDPHIVGVVWFNQKLSHINYSIGATKAGKQAFVRNMNQTETPLPQ